MRVSFAMNDKIEDTEYSSEELKAIAEQDEIDRQYWHEVAIRFNRWGFVAFLDLPGYKQIAASDDERRIGEVVCAIKSAKDGTIDKLCNAEYNGAYQSMFVLPESFFDDIHISYISDSIVIHCDIVHEGELPDETNRKEYLGDIAFWFITFVRQIYSTLLRKKLPSRCAISFGRFFWDAEKDSILAGSALIEANRMSEILPFTGVLLCDSVAKDLAGRLSSTGLWCAIDSYLISDLEIKPQCGESFIGTVVRPNLSKGEVGDVEEFVKRQYMSFGKRIDNDAVKYKLEKTIDLFKMFYVS